MGPVLLNFLQPQLLPDHNKLEHFGTAIHFHTSLVYAGNARRLPLKFSPIRAPLH